MFDRARVDSLLKPKMRGKIDYFRDQDPRGMERFEYAMLVPKTYKANNDDRYPLVISLHGRVINDKHPAFRGKEFAERGRLVAYNNWLKTPAMEDAIVIAPTGNPNGFTFKKDPGQDLMILYRALGAGLTNYRADWGRMFLEVHGSALRVCCEQTFVFAGFIVRDREDDRRRPIIPPEEFFILDNLNGTPLCYIADEARWEKVGKPLAEALEKAYDKIGMRQNLLIMKGKRDANGALKADDAKVQTFIRDHKLVRVRKKFKWRFFDRHMVGPMPVEITGANYYYEKDVPLEKAAGSMTFEIKQETFTDAEGKPQACNVFDIQITEAENLGIRLHDGIVDMSMPISVRVNGEIVADKKVVRRNWNFFAKEILPRRFFMLPFVGRVDCSFKPKPQYVAAKPEKKAAGEEKKEGEDQAVKGPASPDGSDSGK
jgi:hypothetical protein